MSSNKTVKVSLTLNQLKKVIFSISERIQEIIFENDDVIPNSKHYLYSEYQCLKRVQKKLKKLGEIIWVMKKETHTIKMGCQ